MIKRRSLRLHLLLLYVLLAVLSGIVVPALSVRLSLAAFQKYQFERRQADLEALGDSLTALYEEDGGWTRRRVMDILHPAPQWMGMRLILRDAEGNTVFTLGPLQMGEMAKRRHGHGMMHFSQSDVRELTNHLVIELTSGEKTFGKLEVDYKTPSTRFEKDFLSYLMTYTLAGAAVMIAVACGLGFFVAGGLSRPVVKAVERTRRISHGEYELDPVEPTGIREMDALSRGVEELGRSLSGQEKLRQRLMVDIAHELRTPLTVVRTQIEAIADGVWEASPERLRSCVTEMERLSSLIEDVESLTRLEGDALALHLEDTDMAVFLEPVLDALAPLFERADIELRREFAGGLTVEIDSDRFRHVIDNLLSNALRYTPAGGCVEVRLLKREGEMVIEVEDTGIGISEADLPHVFERFYRADESRARVTGGRGVGLAIVKATVEAHGGTISVSSPRKGFPDDRRGRGSCFAVTLPLAAFP
ncbi:MAG: cell wall metabolism sensor histidine kinase WalK [Fretibacterium sp.]|nr:cell wall metabolism sensor histidine kinase WalK [Fretibacterium sp.]